MRIVGVALAVGALSVALAAPAAADEQAYLDRLLPKMAFLTPEVALSEGFRVCAVLNQGRPTPDAVPMVVEDLYTSTSVATDIVTAAAVELC